jgi:large subunit ribosomal protein L10
MPTAKKISLVAELKQRIEQATLVASANYRGLRVKEMQDLRRALRNGGIEVKVVKNTLLQRAANEAGRPELMQIVEGPIALALTSGDVIEAAKTLNSAAQGAPPGFAIRGAYLDGQILSAEDLRELVKVPPRPLLLAQIAGQLQSPLAGLIGLLDAPLRELSGLLNSLLSELPGLIEARARQLETTQ